MKRLLASAIIFMVLFSSGCAKENSVKPKIKEEATTIAESNVQSKTVDFTDIPLYSDLASSTHEIYSSLDDYTESFNLKDYINHKGYKEKRQHTVFDN